jgi:cytochrome b
MANRRSHEAPPSVRVWDPLVRVFHWSLAAAVLIALMSDQSRALHKSAGYVAAGLVVLRVIWGFVGSVHARFADFVRSPGAVLAYLGDVARLHPRRYLGHNPAGGAMILALLGLVLVAALSGWMSETDRFFGVFWVEAVHAGSANLLIGLVVLHVIGVVMSSLLHGENLIRAMITGHKPVQTFTDEIEPGAERT